MSEAENLRLLDYLQHIRDAILRIGRYVKFTVQHPEIPWSRAYEMRNVVSHGYFKVDLAIVWKTIQNDLPQLDKQVANLLANHQSRVTNHGI